MLSAFLEKGKKNEKLSFKAPALLAVFPCTAMLSLSACASDTPAIDEEKGDTAENFVKDVINGLFSGDMDIVGFDNYTIDSDLENYIKTVMTYEIKTEHFSGSADKNKSDINSSGNYRVTDISRKEDEVYGGSCYYVTFAVSNGMDEMGKRAQLHIIDGNIVNFYIPGMFDWVWEYHHMEGAGIKGLTNPWLSDYGDAVTEKYLEIRV